VPDMVFAWVALYGAVNTVSGVLAATVPEAPWLRGCLLAVYDAMFVFWIFRTGRQEQAGLGPVKCAWKDAWPLLLPLAVFPVYNLLQAGECLMAPGFLLHMLCVTLTEELFFRGFLLSGLKRLGTGTGVILTSAAFALLHAVNLAGNGDAAYVCLQILSSFFVSLCYCAVTLRMGNALPCWAAHFLTNITGTGSVSGGRQLLGLLSCIAVYALWGGKWILDIRKKRR